MPDRTAPNAAALARALQRIGQGPWPAVVPVVSLAAYWAAGEAGLLIVALALPLLLLLTGRRMRATASAEWRDHVTGLLRRDSIEAALADMLQTGALRGRETACFVIELDDFRELVDRHGQAAGDRILRRAAERIGSAFRDSDLLARIGDCRFAVALHPVRRVDLETAIQLAARLQASVEEPISLDAVSVYASACVGFCLSSRAPGPSAAALIDSAALALTEAQKAGPSAMRAFSPEMHATECRRHALMDEVGDALENGEITPWFQPQVSTDTGRITGFEALARWAHPTRGMIAPAEFLGALQQGGRLERLGEVILSHSFQAVTLWDSAGLDIPHVSVNFSASELRNPRLVDKIKWELDRHDLAAGRLCIEILENVIATSPDDTTTRNIAALADLECRIDLDDFGTGHASISSIRRFAISRLKIDRSFVMKADRDTEQQRMIGAILTMAERLGLATLAEGVETPGEHAMLAQLGCDDVQGFGIARPMPVGQTIPWVRAHHAKLADAPGIGRAGG